MAACVWLTLWLILGLPAAAIAAGPRALFDNTHAETAGNADWQIDTDQPLPMPDQSNVVPSTPRDYWLGANSSWAIDLVKRGYSVATLTAAFGITYGNMANPYDLSNYDVFIVNEPNARFTAAESTAIFHYVQDGGGLVAIVDHNISDRNGDGYDSPRIWNLLDTHFFFGAHFDTTGEANNNITQDSGNIETSPTDSIIHGPEGLADSVSFHGGTTMVLHPEVNPTVAGDIWMTGSPHGTTNVMVAHATYGSGHIFWVGDSSPADDGSAAPGNINIFDGWGDVSGRDSLLHMNGTLWVTRRCSPEITGFSPTFGSTGNPITISGTRLQFVIGVKFNNVPANFTVESSTRITAYVPPGATGGPLQIVGPCGTKSSVESFFPPGWPLCGVAVNSSAGAQQFPASIPDGAGGVILAWEDRRNVNADIYAQRVNADGQPLWAPSGIPISADTGDQKNPVLCSDGAGGAIVAWQGFNSSNFDVWAARVRNDGIMLWITLVSPTPNGQEIGPAIIGDGAGGAIMAWQDDGPGGNSGFDIKAQRLDPSGTLLWASGGGTLLTSGSGSRLRPVVMADGSGGVFVCWTNGSTGAVFVQRVNSSGVPQWSGQGFQVFTLSGDPQLALVSDAAGGAIVVSGGVDILAQRMNGSGVAQWAFSICSQPGNQSQPAAVPDGAGGVIVAWSDARMSPPSANPDIYAQYVDASGATQWTNQGVIVCNAAGSQTLPRATASAAGGMTVAWQDARGGANDVYAQRLTSAGTSSWTANGVVVCAGTGDQGGPTMVGTSADGVIVGWHDNQGIADYDIKALRLRSDGTVTAVPRAEPAGSDGLRAWPNPSPAAIRVEFALPAAAEVRMLVLDVGGRRVRATPSTRLAAGRHALEWDGRTDAGTRAPAGIYFVRITGSGFGRERSVVLLE